MQYVHKKQYFWKALSKRAFSIFQRMGKKKQHTVKIYYKGVFGMFKIAEKVMEAAKKYTVLDYGFFKFLMISFGVLLGVYYKEYIFAFIWLIWVIFIISAVWMTYKIFIYTK